jgi:hypothetical protein
MCENHLFSNKKKKTRKLIQREQIKSNWILGTDNYYNGIVMHVCIYVRIDMKTNWDFYTFL